MKTTTEEDSRNAGRAESVSVRILESESELARVLASWRQFQRHPNVDWQFYQHINAVFGDKPCVLELAHNGEVKSLWIGRIQDAAVPVKIGYAKLGKFRLRQLNIIYGGVMGDDSEETCSILLQHALNGLEERGVDALVLSYLPCDGSLFRLANKVPSGFWRDLGIAPSVHWAMALPSSYEEFLKRRSKKHRYWLKRLPRCLEEAFPGQVQVRVFRSPAEVSEFCRDADRVAKETYQAQLGEGFRADANYTARCQMLAKTGDLRGYILYIAGCPKAYWMATVCEETLYLNVTGYSPELRKYEIGTILLLRLFEDHCGTKVTRVDFGHGGAPYKERFGDESFLEASVYVYRICPRGIVANSLRGINENLVKWVSDALERLGLLQKVKRLWRNRLGAKAAGEGAATSSD